LRRALASIALALALAGCNAQPVRTGGIVSTNPCADQLLLALAPPGRIAAISHYSQEVGATSVPLDVARRFRGTAGTAEEVVALKPDLVLASSFDAKATLAAYRRLGLKVLVLDSPTTIAASEAQVRAVAAAVGAPAAGEKMVARIERAMASTAPPDTARPSALLFIQGSFANAGPNLLTEMLTRAGFGDGTRPFGMPYSGPLSIEQILAHPPAVVLEPDPNGRSGSLRRHVLAKAGYQVIEERFPRALINCGGPTIVAAMARLGEIRARVPR